MKRTCILPAAMGAMLVAAGTASAQNTVYWDVNGANPGSGNAGGTWNSPSWTLDPTGGSDTAAWVDGDSAVFSAGADGTGTWHVTVSSAITTPSITWKDPFAASGNYHNIDGGPINIGGGTLNSSALGFVAGNGNDVNINAVLAGAGGLTIAAHGDATSDTGGGGGAEFRLNNANNTFSGGLTITSGLVSWNTDAYLGDISNVITLNGGGILCTGASHSTVRDIKVGAAGGTIRTYGSTTLKLTGTLANDAGVPSTTLRRTDGGTLIITTQGTGFAGIFRIGGGDTQLAVANADWSNTDFVVVSGSGKLTPNGGGTAVVNSIESYADVQINNGTTLDVDTGSITMGPANGHWYKTTVGALGKLTSSSGTLTITNGLATGNLTTTDHQVRVQLTDSGATPVALVKNNNNSLVINQDNTYSGGTTINGGRVESNGVPGFGTGAVVVSSGGQAWVNAAGVYPNDFTINGIGVTEGAGNLGAIRFSSLATIGGTLNVASDARITAYDANDRGTIAGPLTGTAALEKTGGGTITLSGDGSGYSGPLTVGAGNVVLGNAIGGDVVVKDGAVIAGEGQVAGKLTLGETVGADIRVDGTTAGALGTADLTVNGLTYVRLSGAPTGAAMDVVTYTGTLALSGVTLDDNFMLVDAGSYRGAPVFANTGSAITLTVPAGDSLVWRGDDATNPTLWDLVTTPNWTGVADPDVYYNGDSVLFDDTGVSKTVDLPEDVLVSPAVVTFNNSAGNDYTLVGDGGDGFTGPTSLVKNGAGTVTMSGYSHNYTGPVTINAGILRANSYEILGNSSGVTINDGGQLDLNGMNLGSFTRHYGLTVAGAGPDGSGAIVNNAGGSPNENAGILNLTMTADTSVGGSGGRFDIGRSGNSWGTVDGNGFTLTKVGSGSVCMRAPDTTDITFVVNAGTLKFEDYNTVTGSNPITVNGGTLQAYGDRTLPNTVNMASGTTLDNDGGGMQTWTGPVNLNITGVVGSNVFLSARSGRIELPGVISGDSSVTANGNNILVLAGAASNTYTGTTSITSTGQLVLAKTGGAVAVPGDLYLSSGGTRGIVATAYDNQFGPDTVLRWASAGDTRLELKGTTQTVAGIDNTGYATRTYHCIQHSEFGNPPAVDGVSDLVLNVAEGASFSYDGALRDQGGRVNVTKNGLGTQQLRNTLIDYTGPTVVNAGRLVVNSDDTHTSAVVLATGAVYEVVSDGTYNNFEHQQACTISGTGTYLKTGASPMSVGWGNGATVAMSSGGLIHIAAGTMRLEYGARTQWAPNKGDMLIDAGATFDLWDNNINDGTYPNAGVFVDALNGEGAITRTHGVTGNLTVGVDDGDGVFSGSISSAPGVTNLIKVGAGTQTLAGANSHTGNTTVNGGTLNLASTGSLAFTVTDAANNQVNGTGAVILDGSFVINTAAVTVTSGSWTLVDTATLTACTYGATFSPGVGWVEDADVWTLVAGPQTWTFTEATGVLSLTSVTYASWIDGFFPGETDPNIIGSDADPDNDSIPNSVEMVIGGDPKDGMDVALLPTIELVTDPAGLPAGNWVLFTYRRTDLAVAAGLTIAGEYGVDLVNWAEAQNGVDGVVILEDDNYAGFDPPATAPTDRVRIYAPQVLQTLFGRLKVTVPEPVPTN